MKPAAMMAAMTFLILPLAAEELNYQQAMQEAMKNSPALAASQQQKDIARGEAYQALTPYDPRVVGEFNYFEGDQPNSNPAFTSQNNGHLGRLSLMSDIPFGGRVSVGVSKNESNDLFDRSNLDPSVRPLATAFAPASPAFNTEFFFTYRQSPLIDLWFLSGINTITAGLARIESARLKANHAKAEIIAGVTNAYGAWSASSEIADVAKGSWEEARDFYNKTKRKHGQGLTELSELLQSESTLHFRRSEYLSAQDREQEAKERLWVSIGREAEKAGTGEIKPGAIPHENWKIASSLPRLEELAIEQRQDVRAAYADVKQMDAFYSRAKSQALPDLAMEYRFRDPGFYQNESDAFAGKDHHPNHTIALTLNVPLWPMLGPRGEILLARGRALAARQQLRAAELELKRAARAAWRSFETAGEALELAEKRVELEGRKMREIDKRYRDGQISGRELLLNQDDLLRARQGKALAHQGLIAAKVKLMLTQGDLVDTILPEAN